MKFITTVFILVISLLFSAFTSSAEEIVKDEKASPQKVKKKPFDPQLSGATNGDQLHPLCLLEDVYPSKIEGLPDKPELKVSAMAFHGNDLYITVFTPDRTNKEPFKKGEVYKITGLIGNSDRSKIVAHRLMGGLYEPTAITVHEEKIYIGEKNKISRLEDKNHDGVYTADEKIVLIDGISQPNFHTYTIGFEKLKKEGRTYLVGNLTTSIKIGGSRDLNITVNPKTRRGSTFFLGPITGEEKSDEVDITYYAGGFRTPNGIGLGLSGEIIVTDNQGVFNPSNKFVRLSPGGFYGHYLLKKKGTNIAAFQPEDVNSEEGGAKFQTPTTVHLPHIALNRSPSQPIIIDALEGPLSVYNGQWLVGDLTQGRLNRVFLEKVEGVWQGAAFLHSGGHDEKGKTGFIAGPNRIVKGPDGQFYIGHIGDGGLWRFLPEKGQPAKPMYGLQRLSFVSADKIPADFNEMVAVRDIAGGLEIELFKSITQDELETANFNIKQWTYIPTKGYGGNNQGEEQLSAIKSILSADGKRIRLSIPGIRDNTAPFISKGDYTNENVGWVIAIEIDKLRLYKNTAYYTMLNHQGGGSKADLIASLDPKRQPMLYAKSQHKAVCSACHSLDGSKLAGPPFNGILGRNQKVVRQGKVVEVKIDESYLMRAIADPLAESPQGYLPAMPDLNLTLDEQKAMVKWLKSVK